MARRLKANDFGEAAVRADDLLENIRAAREIIDDLEREYLEVAARLKAEYETRLKPFREELAGDEKALLALMKACRDALFDGTDVVYLSNGTLVHSRRTRSPSHGTTTPSSPCARSTASSMPSRS